MLNCTALKDKRITVKRIRNRGEYVIIIVLKQHAPDEKVKAFCNELQTMGYQINDSMGSDTHILGLIGDTKALSESWVLALSLIHI